MASLKENIEIQTGGAVLAAQEGLYKSKQTFFGLPLWERVLLIIVVVSLVPGYTIVRYGTELVLTKLNARESLVAQPSFSIPEPLEVGKVSVIKNSNDTYSAYATVTNPNLDLALPNLKYTFKFNTSSAEQVATQGGQNYLLPDQQKLIVAPRVVSSQAITSATLEIEEPEWQKRLTVPEVELRMAEPYVYEEVNPLATIVEGSVVNNSEFALNQASLVIVLYGENNKVLAVSQREEYTIKPYERRAYRLSWPGISRASVKKVDLKAYTNLLDETNLSLDTER